MEITFLIGLPGAGKSHLGNKLSQQKDIPFYDDCGTVQDVWESAQECISQGKDCILADPKMCDVNQLEQLEKHIYKLQDPSKVTFHYIYFANEPELCYQNTQDRSDDRSISWHSIEHLSKKYHHLLQRNNDWELTRPCYNSTK